MENQGIIFYLAACGCLHGGGKIRQGLSRYINNFAALGAEQMKVAVRNRIKAIRRTRQGYPGNLLSIHQLV